MFSRETMKMSRYVNRVWQSGRACTVELRAQRSGRGCHLWIPVWFPVIVWNQSTVGNLVPLSPDLATFQTPFKGFNCNKETSDKSSDCLWSLGEWGRWYQDILVMICDVKVRPQFMPLMGSTGHFEPGLWRNWACTSWPHKIQWFD